MEANVKATVESFSKHLPIPIYLSFCNHAIKASLTSIHHNTRSVKLPLAVCVIYKGSQHNTLCSAGKAMRDDLVEHLNIQGFQSFDAWSRMFIFVHDAYVPLCDVISKDARRGLSVALYPTKGLKPRRNRLKSIIANGNVIDGTQDSIPVVFINIVKELFTVICWHYPDCKTEKDIFNFLKTCKRDLLISILGEEQSEYIDDLISKLHRHKKNSV